MPALPGTFQHGAPADRPLASAITLGHIYFQEEAQTGVPNNPVDRLYVCIRDEDGNHRWAVVQMSFVPLP